MDKRTRVLNALRKEAVDRPPVGFWFHFFGEQSEGDACVAAHLDYYNNIDVDFAKIMCDHYFEYPIPEWVKEPGDWGRLEPLTAGHPFITEQVERAKKIKAGAKDDMCMFYNVFAPFSSIRFGSSEEFVMKSLNENPKGIMHALEVIGKSNALLAEKLITEGGMDGIYYCVQGGEFDRFTVEEYREKITPSDLIVLEHANRFSRYNIMHCCGWAGIKNNLEDWQDYPAAAVNWAVYIENMDLMEGAKFFGKAVLGGFDNRPQGVLQKGTKAEVQAFTKELIARTNIPGVMLGADCTVPSDMDRERIEWVVEAAKECAKG